MMQRAAAIAGLEGLRVHPHVLRHACGYKLANDGVDTQVDPPRSPEHRA
jgi:site-specific recombinase XerD